MARLQRPKAILIYNSLQTLIRLSMSSVEEEKSFVNCVHGAIFFGVPNRGIDITSLIPMAGEQPNRLLLDSIAKRSELLRAQCEQFEQAFPFRDSKVISIYEKLLSPTAVKVREAREICQLQYVKRCKHRTQLVSHWRNFISELTNRAERLLMVYERTGGTPR
jgi:hypothetical protein